MLAEHGCLLTDIESKINYYFFILKILEKLKAGEKSPDEEFIDSERKFWPPEAFAKLYPKETDKGYQKPKIRSCKILLKKGADELCPIFIQAVNSEDSNKVLEIGRAIEFVTSFEESKDHSRCPTPSCNVAGYETEKHHPQTLPQPRRPPSRRP